MTDWRDWSHVVIYGGTFDPPHRAHIELPAIAARQVGADGVLYIPAGQPPHKPDDDRTPAPHRLAMLTAALADQPHTAIWDHEVNRSGPSYTAHTLEALREQIGPDVALRLLMGMDMAAIFDKWFEPRRVEAIAPPLVMVRPPRDRQGFLDELPAADRDRWADRLVDVPAMDVSSSAIRQAIAKRGLDDALVKRDLPRSVIDYIAAHGLYGIR